VSDFAKDYIDVSARIAEFYNRYPEGSLQMDPPEWVDIEGARFIWARGYAYRTPDDPRPGIGHAWEPVPGRTPYTRGSELMNLETSVWGRCTAALGIATKSGIASAQEVRGAEGRRQAYTEPPGGSGPASRPSAREATRPAYTSSDKEAGYTAKATDKQVGYLRKIMKEQNISEYLLADFAAQDLGFEVPKTGLQDLTKYQAGKLIDGLTKQPPSPADVLAVEDPWANVPPPEVEP